MYKYLKIQIIVRNTNGASITGVALLRRLARTGVDRKQYGMTEGAEYMGGSDATWNFSNGPWRHMPISRGS